VSIRVGINGFGRIGRLTFRAIYEKYGLNGDVQVVALNDLTDAKTNAHLLEFDSNYGPFKGKVGYEGNDLIVEAPIPPEAIQSVATLADRYARHRRLVALHTQLAAATRDDVR